MLNDLMLDDPGEAAQSVDDKLGVTAEELRSALEEIAPIARDPQR